jgi:hypothetical protein
MAWWRKDRALLDLTPVEYGQLTDAQAFALKELIQAREDRRARYARLGMMCSTICFVVVTGGYIFLVMEGHNKAALILLGTNVLAFLGRFIKARL